ncbi:alginate O-acetyltransferase AlgF [Zavarzinia compransoris]|nr:alginate O-acetyltransferase AlgF [Zavarzinia compransoris]
MRAVLFCLAAALPATAAAEAMLYETGPGVPSGYVRFLNASAAPVAIRAGGAAIELGAGSFSRYQAIPSGAEQRAKAGVGGTAQEVRVTAATDEFVTVAIVAGAAPLLIRDLPQDFNALKADIAFLNADPACADAAMRAGARKTVVFERIAPGAMARRLVNPVEAVIEAACGTDPVTGSVDLGMLAARGRYSIAVIPDGAGGHRLVGGRDEQAKYD